MHDLTVAEDRLVDGERDLMIDLSRETRTDAQRLARKGKRTGRAMDSIRSYGPVVKAGEGIEHYGFADFGGKVGRNRSIERLYIKGGRYLFVAVRGLGVMRRADDMVDEATKVVR